jgi:hypothetical protein
VAFVIVLIVAIGIYISKNTVARIAMLQQQNTLCLLKFYDISGNGYETQAIVGNYEGVAPLFLLDPELLNLQPDQNGCYGYPDQIDPGLVQQGKQVYPVGIFGKPDKNIIKVLAGESFSLTLQANILEKFQAGTFPLILEPNQRALLDFRLSAPSFDIQPSAAESTPVEIGFGSPAEFSWILFPKEKALGLQKIQGEIRSSGLTAKLEISIEVKTPLGISGSVWLLLGIIAAGFVFVIGNWDNVKLFFSDIKNYISNLFRSGKKK